VIVDDKRMNETMIMLLVQLLSKRENHGLSVGMGDVYEWAAGEDSSASYRYEIVSVQSVIRPVFVVPVFRDGYNQLNPNHLDRFIVLDRRYFDRSGWDVENHNVLTFKDAKDQRDYLDANQTEARMFTSCNYYQMDNDTGDEGEEEQDNEATFEEEEENTREIENRNMEYRSEEEDSDC